MSGEDSEAPGGRATAETCGMHVGGDDMHAKRGEERFIGRESHIVLGELGGDGMGKRGIESLVWTAGYPVSRVYVSGIGWRQVDESGE